ncbi:ATP-dependent helicase HrpB [Archangium gephyra]|nr:ATP-dependent helicase HrpB [Archangium gephyra]
MLADKARVQSAESVHAVAPVTETVRPVLNAVSNVVRELEHGQRVLDRIIQAAGRCKQFTNAEMLSLQASVYRYTQELDLVSRVVEKGTSGLKDVLKTQV